jgi:hypothetical protein
LSEVAELVLKYKTAEDSAKGERGVIGVSKQEEKYARYFIDVGEACIRVFEGAGFNNQGVWCTKGSDIYKRSKDKDVRVAEEEHLREKWIKAAGDSREKRHSR